MSVLILIAGGLALSLYYRGEGGRSAHGVGILLTGKEIPPQCELRIYGTPPVCHRGKIPFHRSFRSTRSVRSACLRE